MIGERRCTCRLTAENTVYKESRGKRYATCRACFNAYHARYNRLKRRKNALLGRCAECNRKAVRGATCLIHKKAHRVRQAKRRAG